MICSFKFNQAQRISHLSINLSKPTAKLNISMHTSMLMIVKKKKGTSILEGVLIFINLENMLRTASVELSNLPLK